MRLFVALELDPTLRHRLARAADGLVAHGGRVRRVAEARLHLTLRFLGEVPDSRVEAVTDGTREATLEQEGFTLDLRGLGTFPGAPRPPRVVWAGVAPAPALDRLVARLEQALVRRGFPPERQGFTAHVTLARCQGRVRFDAPLDPLQPVFGPQVVERITVMESVLTGQGPEYTPVAVLPLPGSSD